MGADWLLLVDEPGVVLVELSTSSVERRDRPMIDGSITADFLFSENLPGHALLATGDGAVAATEWAMNVLLSGRCAEICGLLHRMMEDTQRYLVQRQQFGMPIAGFQVLRHRLADMAMARMKAVALTEAAVASEASGGDLWSRAVSAACIEAGDAARIVGEGAVQLHGAMGLTEELALGRYYKRALALAAALGAPAHHLERHASLSAAA